MLSLILGSPQRRRADAWSGGGWSSWPSWGGTSKTQAGALVDEDRALCYSAVFCATRVICETLATLPLVLYRRQKDGGSEEATDEPLYDILRTTPNPTMGSMAFREGRTQHQVNWGNGFAEIERDRSGEVVALHPIHPRRVRPVYRTDGAPGEAAYIIWNNDGTRMWFRADEILHIPGCLTEDGIWGKGVITYARESVGMGIATERHGANTFGGGSLPRGVLTTPGVKSPEARKQLREEWKIVHGSPDSNEIAILPPEAKFTPITISNEDNQYLGTRKFNINEIARWYRVAPHKLMDLLDGARAGLEVMGTEFVTDSLMSWAVRWEDQIALKLIPADRRKELFVAHDFKSLMRGDFSSRVTAYHTAINDGVLTINEARRLENLPSIGEAGDQHYVPVNLTTAERMLNGEPPPGGAPGGANNQPKPGGIPGKQPAPPNPFDSLEAFDRWSRELSARLEAAAKPPEVIRLPPPEPAPLPKPDTSAARLVLLDTLSRMFTKESNAAQRAAKDPTFDTWLQEWYDRHQQTLTEALTPAAAVLRAAGVDVEAPCLAANLVHQSRAELRQSYDTLTPAQFAAVLLTWPTGRARLTADAILQEPERWCCGGPGSGRPGPCPGEGKGGGKKPEDHKAKIEKAKAKLEKAKQGVIKAKKELADLRAKAKAETAAAKAASSKAKAEKPVDAGEHKAATIALDNRFRDKSVKVSDIEKHVEGLGKALNKGQMIDVARGLGMQRTFRTKADAQKAIRVHMVQRKGAWDRVDA